MGYLLLARDHSDIYMCALRTCVPCTSRIRLRIITTEHCRSVFFASLCDAVSADFSCWPACPCQRMSAPQSPFIAIFPWALCRRPCNSGQGADGTWFNCCSCASRKASAATEPSGPTRPDAYLVLVRNFPRPKTNARRVGCDEQLFHGLGANRTFRNDAMHSSSTTWCACVAAARWHTYLNPTKVLG